MNVLQSSAIECRQLAEETAGICVHALMKGQAVLNNSKEIKDSLDSLPTRNASANTFVKITKLIENNKIKEAKDLVSEMDDMALMCADKSKAITIAMQKGVDSLPSPAKDHLQEEDRETDNEEELLDLSQDIEDLETCTRDIKRMNLFSAARSGADGFRGLLEKEELCRTMFGKIKDFAVSIVRLTDAFMNQNCCVQIGAAITNAGDLMKCIRLGALMSKIAEAVRKLFQAIIRFMQTALERIFHLAEEFQAAKKIKNFVAKPFESSRIGKRIKQGLDLVGKQ